MITGEGLRLQGPQVPHFPLEGRQGLGVNEVLARLRDLLLPPLPAFETAAVLPGGVVGAGGTWNKEEGRLSSSTERPLCVGRA